MNKNPKKNKENNGFYLALYSCIGAVVVLAGVFTFNNISQTVTPEQIQLSTTNSSTDKSYLEKQLEEEQKEKDNKEKIKVEEPKESEKPKVTDDIKAELKQENNDTQKPQEDKKEGTDTKKDTSENEDSSPLVIEQANNEIEEVIDLRPVFKPFSIEETMTWPVVGEIVMDYSDKLVYDATLEQYRTNDIMSISSEVGSQVASSANGVVASVSDKDLTGVTVMVDHGNGWFTEYSQLQEDVLVTEGDFVKQGQVIGGVARPTKSKVLLGNHLGFKVVKDNQEVDPKTLLSS